MEGTTRMSKFKVGQLVYTAPNSKFFLGYYGVVIEVNKNETYKCKPLTVNRLTMKKYNYEYLYYQDFELKPYGILGEI